MTKILDQKLKNLVLADYKQGLSIKEIKSKYHISIDSIYTCIGSYRRYKKRPQIIVQNITIENFNPEGLESHIMFTKLDRYEKEFYLAYLALTGFQPREEDIPDIKELFRYLLPGQAKGIMVYKAIHNPTTTINLKYLISIAKYLNLRPKARKNGKNGRPISYSQTDEEKVIYIEDLNKWLWEQEQKKKVKKK